MRKFFLQDTRFKGAEGVVHLHAGDALQAKDGLVCYCFRLTVLLAVLEDVCSLTDLPRPQCACCVQVQPK